MKFLAKAPESPLRRERYRSGGHNEHILDGLLQEQHGFCAYSEARVRPLHTAVVEHFDPSLKNTDGDGYENWYGVLERVNQRKRRREKSVNRELLSDRWFQHAKAVAERVEYDPLDHHYYPRDPNDSAARELLDYLGFNESEVVIERRRHVERTRHLLDLARLSNEDRLNWFREHPDDLAFPSALERCLELDLTELIPHFR